MVYKYSSVLSKVLYPIFVRFMRYILKESENLLMHVPLNVKKAIKDKLRKYNVLCYEYT